MDFGKLASVDGLTLELPADATETSRVLASSSGERRGIFVGAPVWAHDGFVGKIYPEACKARDYLRHYGRQFPTIELNSTYYGVRPDWIARWAESVPLEFRFCPKLPGAISHERRLRDVERETHAFFEAIAEFGPRLGIAWTVLPPSFGPERFDDLERFVVLATRLGRLAVELRHRAWFANSTVRQRLFAMLEEHGATAIITDVAGRRDVLHMQLTSATCVIRFSGNRLHATDFSRLDAWATRLGEWWSAGLEEAYVFLHQPVEHWTVDLAEHLVPRLSEATGLPLRAPHRIEKREQGQLF